MPVLNETNRLKFMLLTEAELHPQSELGRWIKDKLYEDPKFIEKMALTSMATIERDNRVLESKGWFMKEKDVPKVPQPDVKPTQMTL